MLEFALRYAQAGLKVMPLRPRGKLPLTSHGAHDATTDESQIRSWWRQWPDANIGVTLGGMVVIDIDPRNDGDVSALPPLPDTCYAKTGGGGQHFLYRSDEGVRYNAHPAPGIDVKSGHGAYIVVEPSVHETGGTYSWLDESEPWAVKPSPAPSWLSQRQSTPTAFTTIAAGSRNDTLTSMAGSMRRRGMSVEAITAALLAENARCVPALDEEEVKRIAQSVARYAPDAQPVAQVHEEPLPSAIKPSSVRDELLRVHREGLGRGDRAGWSDLDKLFSVAPAQLTTVTGWPNSGKSQWLDSLALNLSKQGWQFVFCSLENIPVFLHVEKLAKQHVGKPVRNGPTERMSEQELSEAADALDKWCSFVLPADKKPNPSLLDVIETIEAEFKARGVWGDPKAKRACVIDPWNELEHVRTQGLSLTEYIGSSLSMLRQWSRRNLVHVFLVGHPAKQQRNRESGKLPTATPDMISDSAHFWNKSDNCITVSLVDEHRSQEVDIHVQKIRFAHIGSRGVATLIYDKTTGRYHDKQSNVMDFKTRASGVKDF